MIYNQAIFQKQAKDQMMQGIEKLAKAVKSTIGPNGKNCIIQVNDQSSIITKDGVTVARSFHLKQGPEKIGANLVKQVASRTARLAGDGTSASIILAQAIFREGLKKISAPGIIVNQLKRGIDQAVQSVVKTLEKNSKKISSYNQIVNIATISANNDRTIGKVIANAIQAVGIDGTVTVQLSQTSQTSYSVVQGMEFGCGYLSPYFINNQQAGIVEFQNPFILMYGKKISTIQEILPVLQAASQQKAPLLIIADEIQQEALTTLVVNKMKGVLSVAAVKAPSFGEMRKQIMLDIAALTDGTYISQDLGMTLQACKDKTVFGTAKKVKISSTGCTIIGSAEINRESLGERVKQIENDISLCKNQNSLKILKKRLSKLTNGVAVIHVGASSAVQLGEKKDRIDDALCATRAAIQEGVVAGGGTAFVKAEKSIKISKSDSASFQAGQKIIKDVLQIQLKTIMQNAGLEADKIYNKIRKNSSANYGYNVLNEKFGDMMKEGVIDPLKVSRTALESAASVAGLLLTTECVLALKQDPDPNPPAPVIQPR